MYTRYVRAFLFLVVCCLTGVLFFFGSEAFLKSGIGRVYVDQAPRSLILVPPAFSMVGLLVGFLLSARLAQWGDRFSARLDDLSHRDLLLASVGAIFGGVVVAVLTIPVSNVFKANYFLFLIVYLPAITIGALVGFERALTLKGELGLLFGRTSQVTPDETDIDRMKGGKILDTNVIIDGRVLEVLRAGFLQGTVYIPGFVLDELQYIADSADSLKRARGRRGLDILNQIRKDSGVIARDLDHLIPENQPVDTRLVALARHLSADIVTNDYNLNKVAELQGVQVLNINQLANALKPVVMAGEEITASIIKEGKELNQGIAYLDDGTMIVVENGRRFVGETIEVVVTSVLQTVAGKMIFASPRVEHEREEELLGRNIRSYSGSGARRKTRSQ